MPDERPVQRLRLLIIQQDAAFSDPKDEGFRVRNGCSAISDTDISRIIVLQVDFNVHGGHSGKVWEESGRFWPGSGPSLDDLRAKLDACCRT